MEANHNPRLVEFDANENFCARIGQARARSDGGSLA